jgi:glycosyltransferase involved in cell wall biosynthesis
MVILSVHNTADIYGASRSLLRMLRRLTKDGHEVHVVLPGRGPLVNLLLEHGINVHRYEPLAVIDRNQLRSFRGAIAFALNFQRSVFWLAALMLRQGFDVVHTNSAVIPAPALAAKFTGRRHVWHIREFFSDFPSLWKLYQWYVGLLSAQIVANSLATREQFSARLRKKCSVIYNGLDEDSGVIDRENAQRFRASLGNPKWLIGVVGRIKWVRKGQEVLVKAAALLANEFPDTRYVVVGSCAPGNEDHLVRLHELIHEKGLKERFIFAGELEDLRDIYAAFDLTVVPSMMPEPFGCVVVESMAVGTPVVGTRIGGIPEQIVDGTTGLLFEPGDEVGLARALSKLMSDEALRLSMADACRRRFQNTFSLDTAYSKFSEIIGLNIREVNQRYPSSDQLVCESADSRAQTTST